MRGLTIIVVSADAVRLHGALSLAAASAAMGSPTRVHLHVEAVALLRAPIATTDDDRYAASGLPTLAQMLDEALGLGVAITACQSGLALAGLAADMLDPRVSVDGPIGVLGSVGEGRLLTV